jgi:NAD(P)-dependent dehydrogenase (short-subunit alcohol dehydrogenase family)
MAKKRIFITGGASGLGRAIALRYARAGYAVCIGDIHDERGADTEKALRALGADAFYMRCNVTEEAEFERVRDALQERWGGVDIVVNNAGVASAGKIDETSVEDWRWIIEINLLGVVRGCKVFTPVFKRQGSGYFVNVASMAGLINAPFMNSYNVTKAGVISLSETLETELYDEHIGVSVLCPAFVKTNLAESVRAADPRMAALTKKLVERGTVSAEAVADAVFDAVKARRFYVLPHDTEARIWLAKRALPRSVFARIVVQRARKFR